MRKFPCTSCGHECGPDEIHGCFTFQCPKCGTVFEPDLREEHDIELHIDEQAQRELVKAQEVA